MGGLVLPVDDHVSVTYQRGTVQIHVSPTDVHFREALLDEWSRLSLADQAILLAVAQTIISVERAR